MIDTTHEKNVREFYTRWTSHLLPFWDVDETLCLHHGFFEPGIHSFKDAVLNMNRFVGSLLGLNEQKPMKILDAGCGLGGVSIFFAEHFPQSSFIGITLADEHVKLAQFFSRQRGLSNVDFQTKNFLETEFPGCYFDAIFAVESASYATNFMDFILEMYRILKPGGRLVVIDGFLRCIPTTDFLKKTYMHFSQGLGGLQFSLLHEFCQDLQNTGFSAIEVQNISRNVRPSFFAHAVVGFPFYIIDSLKKIHHQNNKQSQIPSTSAIRSTSIYGAVVVLKGFLGYYAVTAIKPE
ncbi:MAG: methyltransferase domain-containing protein [Candidatus Thermoplasmatota archaeon]